MAFDPNLNSSGSPGRNHMNELNTVEFPDWYHNEESFDLTNLVSNSGNLELCNDDLFQNLFPTASPSADNLKKDNPDQVYDNEVDNWCHGVTNEPHSACASACSSAATSPVPLNFYNTPPVTPQSERLRTSPHHFHQLQLERLTKTMSSSQFPSMRDENQNNSFPPARHMPLDTRGPNEINQMMVKREPETTEQAHLPFCAPTNVKSEADSISRPVIVDVSNAESMENHISPLGKRPMTDGNEPTAKKAKLPMKGTMEYFQKRQRNNIAVRRSRDKAKQKAMETQKKVDELTTENEKLHARVSQLSHELTTLKNLLNSLPHVST